MTTTYRKLLDLYNNNTHKMNLALISIEKSKNEIKILTEENDEIKDLLSGKVAKNKIEAIIRQQKK